MTHRLAPRIDWLPGPLADCVQSSLRARTQEFIVDADSEPIRLFGPEDRAFADAGDWYGEHAGKWLVTAVHAYRRTGDAGLAASIGAVLNYLASVQEPDGYLGTYAPDASARFTCPEAERVRTWDLWVHAWIILGILAAAECEEFAHHRSVAIRVGRLIEKRFAEGSSPVDQGNHQGLSSAVIVEPMRRLVRDLEDAEMTDPLLDQLEARGIAIRDLSRDVADLGTGKIYQLLWLFLGMALEPGDPTIPLRWEQIRAGHLNPLGGPWGGIGGHKEVFNAPGFFDPAGMVETCSTATWMALSQELFLQTGEDRYVEEFERSFLNALLGALDANGRDWCYFTFANGRRNNTYHWACCKSSGAMALEQAVDLAVTETEDGMSVNLFVPVRCTTSKGQLEQTWEWQGLDLVGTIRVQSDSGLRLRIRRPAWCREMQVDRDALDLPAGESTVTVRFVCEILVTPHRHTIDHHGQEIVCEDYAFVSLGPLVYACGRFDGFREDETLRLAQLTPAANFHLDGQGEFGPRLALKLPGRAPIEFLPYAEAGGRHDHAWRRTWLQVAWQ